MLSKIKNWINNHREQINNILSRAIKTVFQTAIATVGAATVISEVNWIEVASAALLAGILSILTNVTTAIDSKTKESEK